MLRFSFYTQSLLDVDPEALGLEADSFEHWLPTILPSLVTEKDFRGFYEDEGLGTPSCCPIVLTRLPAEPKSSIGPSIMQSGSCGEPD
jgi:hypothetical protein